MIKIMLVFSFILLTLGIVTILRLLFKDDRSSNESSKIHKLF